MATPPVFSAFFDCGGHPADQPFVIVSGYLANIMQWGVFNANWNGTHEMFKKLLPFHASDCMHGRPPYDSWEVGSKDLFLTSLCVAQQLNTLLSVSCVVDMGNFRGVNEVLQLDTMLPAYALGARYCVEMLEGWKKQFEIEYEIECVFENGDFGKGKFIDLMRVERMPAPIFRDKNEFPGLQAADHLAWEQGNFLKGELKLGRQPIPNERLSRMLSIPHIHRRTTLTSLLDIAEKKGIPIRRSKILKP